jgi:hypothetical protein
MSIFLNLTLHSFGRENFVPLVQIGKFQKGLIEETKAIKWCVIHSQHAILVGEKSSKAKTARTYAPTEYFQTHYTKTKTRKISTITKNSAGVGGNMKNR